VEEALLPLPGFLLDRLACPRCGGGLEPVPGPRLACPEGHGPGGGWPLRGGVPRLLPESAPRAGSEGRTLAAFERQWRTYGRLRSLFGKTRREMGANLLGPRLSRRIDARWYEGRTVLDAGCGHGRYLDAFRALGARVVGLDAGEVPGLARGAQEGVACVQGSVLAPPFRPASFDLVFCDGVLHHTPDPRGGYRALARLVKPGGALYVWLYPEEGPWREAVFGAARRITTRLPAVLVRILAFALVPLTVFVRSYSGTRLGRATWSECAQVVHDWIAPPLQSHHSEAQVRGWAREAGLVDVEVLPVPVGVTAWRSAPS
jgi:SAM-dependent methyltransferase